MTEEHAYPMRAEDPLRTASAPKGLISGLRDRTQLACESGVRLDAGLVGSGWCGVICNGRSQYAASLSAR